MKNLFSNFKYGAVVDYLLPLNRYRGLIPRIIREILCDPSSLPNRINTKNIKNFFITRKHRFFCPVCGCNSYPLYDFPNILLRAEHKIGIFRETLQCKVCFASTRERSLAVKLLDVFHGFTRIRHMSVASLAEGGLVSVKVLDTDNFSAISHIMRNDNNYIRCSYFPNKPMGIEIENNYYNIDLESIAFDDSSFDIVLTSDVMEHVRNVERAHKEISRVLKFGGKYIFNVPYDENSYDDLDLIDTTGDVDVFLCDPQYHGDPITGGILAYRVFGRNIIDRLKKFGFEVEFERLELPHNLVIDGDIFVASKDMDLK